MAGCTSCIRAIVNFFDGSNYPAPIRMPEIPQVALDTEHMGNDVVIVKNGRRICGSGAALGNTAIAQDKAYFEVKIQQTGVWGIGLATRKTDLNKIPLGNDGESWTLRDDRKIYHNGQIVAVLPQLPEEGDVIGLTYDHVELVFYLNGDPTDCRVTGIKGEIYPVLYVDDGAILEATFTNFFYRSPSGFGEILIEQTIL